MNRTLLLGAAALTLVGSISHVSASPKPNLATPSLSFVAATKTSITLRVHAGSTGLPYGFDIHWIKAADAAGLNIGDWPNNLGYPSASNSAWAVPANGSVDVTISGLDCGTEYLFSVRGKGGKNYQLSAWSTPLSARTRSCGFEDGDFLTSGQGGYGNNGLPYQVLAASGLISEVSPLVVGGTHTLTFSSALAVQTFLPAGGTPGVLTASVTDPAAKADTGAGVFAGQVVTLKINVGLSGAPLPAGFGDLVLANMATLSLQGVPLTASQAAALNGQSISAVLAAAELRLGGDPVPYGLSAGQFNELVTLLNESFETPVTDELGNVLAEWGRPSAFANAHLAYP